LESRPRPSPVSPFIWSRSGIGNSFNRYLASAHGYPTLTKLQCEYGN
jgi:hypothetical protein